MTRCAMLALVGLLLAGCTTPQGHRKEQIDIGLSFLGVKIVSVARITTEHVGHESVRAGARLSGAQPEIPAALKLLDTSDGIKILDIGPPALPQTPGPPGTSIPQAPGGGADTSPPTGGPGGTSPMPGEAVSPTPGGPGTAPEGSPRAHLRKIDPARYIYRSPGTFEAPAPPCDLCEGDIRDGEEVIAYLYRGQDGYEVERGHVDCAQVAGVLSSEMHDGVHVWRGE